ncbi:phage/plasmid primase, P4 family [Streptococcus fryi]
MKDLKSQTIWHNWKLVEKDGRKNKMPIYRKPMTYEQALAKARFYDGVGFVVPAGYFFLDIDHRTLEDEVVIDLLARLDTYAEHSQSGNGVHLYGKVNEAFLPIEGDKLSSRYYTKNPHNKMELYFGSLTKRFCVFTGDTISDMPVTDVTESVLSVLDDYMSRHKAEPTEEVDTFDLICQMRKAKNGEKFKKLFDQGDYSDFGSQSEADLSLCSMMVFWTGDNPPLLDQLFRESALYREKWERDDYREETLRKAIQSCQGNFYGDLSQRVDFIDFNGKKCVINCPKLANHIRQNLDYIFVRDTAKNGVLKYVYQDGVYQLYADDMFKGLIKSYIIESDERLLKMSVVDEVFKQLTTDLTFVPQHRLDGDEHLINFKNGLLNLETMILHPHSSKVYSTVQLNCDWQEVPKPTPVFDSFMANLTNGDEEIKELLLQFMGVCLSNIKGWRMKKALFLYGEGNTGKSQLKSLVERILGKGNYLGIDLREIEARFGTGNIYGKRLIGSSDMSFLTIDELKTFKKCTGGDSLFAEFKGQNGFEFTYNGLLWFCMNQLPRFGGDDGQWVYDRILQVHCPNVIAKDKQDKFLLDKLYQERNGIVQQAIKALKTVVDKGYQFTEPSRLIEERTNYRIANNSVLSFFTECMEEHTDNDNPTVTQVYRTYVRWCQENNNNFSKTKKDFQAILSKHLGVSYQDMVKRVGKGIIFKAYCLVEEGEDFLG